MSFFNRYTHPWKIEATIIASIVFLSSLLAVTRGLNAQNSAQTSATAEFQMLVPAPDPVNAGEKVSFQVIAINKGAEVWEKGGCEFEVEIYDSQKNYLAKSSKIKTKEAVDPGGTILDFVTFNVPPAYSGAYFFRVSITRNNERLAYSEFQQFNVTPLSAISPALKPPSDVQIGGNCTIAYKNESTNNWKNYVGNVSLNMLGSIYQKSVVCNLYTYHTPEKPFDLYNFILDYRTQKFDITLGDIMPNFSALSMSNAGMRGVLPVVRAGPTTTSVAIARSIDPVQGTDTANGTFARYTYAINEKIDVLYDNSIGISYVTSNDDKTSITTLGPSPQSMQAARNTVTGINFTIGALKYVTIKTDYAMSSFSTSTVTDTEGPKDISDSAYKAALDSRLGIFSIRAGYQHVGTDFNSLASPTIAKDKNTYDFGTGVGLPKIGSFSLAYNSSVDNLKNDVSKITTKQNVTSVNTNLTLRKWPILSLGYALNDITGAPVESTSTVKTLDNKTNILMASIGYSMPWWINSVSFQQSDFKDAVKDVNDKQTLSGTYSTTFIFWEKISLNLGITDTKITDMYDKSLNVLDTFSLTLNYKVIKDKLMLAFWGNSTQRKDNDLTLPAQNTTQVSNAEITYYFTQQFSWTVGGGASNYKDILAPANDTSITRASTRVGIGF